MRLICPRRGFTLVESVFAMVILMIGGLAAVGAVVYTRQSMELNKQQFAALHYCRRTLERVSALGSVTGGTVSLVPFNAPGLEIDADVRTEFFPFDTDGAVDWSSPALEVDSSSTEISMQDLSPPGAPYLCRVTVEWLPSGSWARPQAISMQTVVRRGVR